mmetsp:Transcript_23847/g.68684  ORF Transcript_23847/g.68684 Transcript_23847/m.68684 type:complete len:251 (+) Transcript_23847:62-814(+)
MCGASAVQEIISPRSCESKPYSADAQEELPSTACSSVWLNESPRESPRASPFDSSEEDEEALTADVPALLDAMNHAAEEVNGLERQRSEAQKRHQQHIQEWRRQYEALRENFGSRVLDEAARLLEAEDAVKDASDSAQAVLAELVAAGPSSAADAAYAEALAVYRKAHDRARHVRESTSGRYAARPLQALKHLARELRSEERGLLRLAKHAETCKRRYGHAMAELDRISTAVHTQRRLGRAALADVDGRP